MATKTCKLCEQEVEGLKEHLAEVHDLTVKAYNRLVQCRVCNAWLKQINAQHVATHDMTLDEYERYDPTPAFMGERIETFYRVREEPEPSPPEPTMTIRLVKCPSNPFSCAVEARPMCVYHFTQPTRGKPQWQSLPAPDAWILLGTNDIPPKYPDKKFEKRR